MVDSASVYVCKLLVAGSTKSPIATKLPLSIVCDPIIACNLKLLEYAVPIVFGFHNKPAFAITIKFIRKVYTFIF